MAPAACSSSSLFTGVYALAADLPPAPAWERWVLEQPIPLAVAFVAVGVILMIVSMQRDQARRGVICFGVSLVAGAALLGVGAAVQTDREAMTRETWRLVHAVTRSDVSTVDQLLDDRLVIASAGSAIPGEIGKPQALDTVRGFEWFKIDEWSYRPNGAVLDGPNAGRTQAIIRVRSSTLETTLIPMTWEFTWARLPDDTWKVTRLEFLSIWGRKPPESWPRMAHAAAAWQSRGRPQSATDIDGLVKDRR